MAETGRGEWNSRGAVLGAACVRFPWAPGLAARAEDRALNAWIKDYAAQKGYVYVDYYSAMKDDRGGLPATLSRDGVHPLPAGFAIMTPLAEAGIEKALKQPMR